MSTTPIADYALISDCHSAALVSRAGSVDWLCFPRFDSRSVFARLLDESAGHWSIRPSSADAQISRRYIEHTMVLETTFRTSTGTALLMDALAIGRNERGHEVGADSPGVLLRQITCTSGEMALDVEYAPRPEYGLICPLLALTAGSVAARGGADVLMLSSLVELMVEGSMARTHFTLREGEIAGFALEHSASWEPAPEVWSQDRIRGRLDDTMTGWRTWSSLHQAYEGPWHDLVHHSGCVLQALTFQPTGAIVAAPTTSLPESIGGMRNWDYRYTWIRDASLTLDALWIAACPDEAHHFFAWMAGAVATQIRRGVDLQIMFGVGGERDLTERTLDHLAGNTDDRRPVPRLVRRLFGRLFGDKGYISQPLAEQLLVTRGVRLITKLRKNMRNILLPLADRLLLRKRALIETIIDQLKNVCQIEHSRHRSPFNFLVHLLAGLAAYCHQPKKPSLALDLHRRLATSVIPN